MTMEKQNGLTEAFTEEKYSGLPAGAQGSLQIADEAFAKDKQQGINTASQYKNTISPWQWSRHSILQA